MAYYTDDFLLKVQLKNMRKMAQISLHAIRISLLDHQGIIGNELSVRFGVVNKKFSKDLWLGNPSTA